MKMEINAPWGNVTIDPDDSKGMIKHCLAQLKYFQKQNDTEHVRADIEGYELILSSENPNGNAKRFLDMKRGGLLGEREQFRDNLKVIEHMKESNSWQ